MRIRFIVSFAVLTAFSLVAFAGDPLTPTAGSPKDWQKVVWVDEKGVKHITMVARAGRESEPANKTQVARQEPLPAIITARVVRAKGVEAIELDNGRVIRYIGVQGPPSSEPAYKQAVAYHKRIVEGKWVNILPGAEPRAPDGSLWAFVFINRLTFVNAELIRFGYAYAHPIEPNTEYKVLFDMLQNRASSRKLGLWNKNTQ